MCTALCELAAVLGEASHCGADKICNPINPAWPAIGICVDTFDCTTGGPFTDSDWCCDTSADCPDPDMSCLNNQCHGYKGGSCSSLVPCGAGLDCIESLGIGFCQNACTSHDDCLAMELCQGPDGVPGFDDHCFPNICRPGGGPGGPGLNAPNFFQNTGYYETCNSTDVGNGLCFGPLPGQENDPKGACFDTVGEKQQGATCDPTSTRGSTDNCNNGLCAPEINTCATFCSLWDSQACPVGVDGNATACAPLFGLHGFCGGTNSPTPPQVGDSCTVSLDEMVCGDDLICVPDGLVEGAPGHCRALCKIGAPAGQNGACPAGVCNPFNEEWPELGACLQ